MTIRDFHLKLGFPLTLFVVSILIRVFFAPIFLDPPILPHDFYAYLGGAKCLLAGGALYSGRTMDTCWSLYGPALSYLFAAMLRAFGEDFLLLKLPAILLESAGVVVFFYLARDIIEENKARYISVLYSFSYFTLISSGIKGNDDSIFMFFILLGTYLLVRGRLFFSAVTIGTAAAFKVVAIVMFPALLMYLYRRYAPRKTVAYCAVAAATLLIFFLPVLFRPESNVSWYLFGNAVPTETDQSPAHLGIFNLIRITHSVVTYLMYSGVSDQSSFVLLMNRAISLINVGAMLGVLAYMLYFGIKNSRIELMRNLFILPFTVTLSGSLAVPDYILWFLPFILLLSGYVAGKRGRNSIGDAETWGIFLLISGLFIFAAFYRETLAISNTLRVVLWFVVILSTVGTYLSLSKLPATMRRALTGLVFASSLFDIDVSSPLLVFKGVLEGILPASLVSRVVVVAFMGRQYYSSPVDNILYLSFFIPMLVIFILSMLMLPVFFHKKLQDQRCRHPPLKIIKRFLGGLYKS